MSDERKVLTIARNRWRRYGHGKGQTQLLNKYGQMCCLGFDALARGVRREAIKDVGHPVDVNLPTYRAFEASHIVAIGDAIEANDSPGWSDAERESKVREALLCLGWDDVKFIDTDEKTA